MMSKKNLLFVAILMVLSMPAIWPIVTPGFFPMHDDTQVVRVYEMHKALSSGQFPVRWVPDLGYGYGYPIFNFYNPLPYYFGAFWMFLGFDALAAAKIMFVFPIILAGVSMFVLTRLTLSRAGALLAGLLYVYAPYHAVQIYVRGAVAEYWAYALLPLVFWSIWKKKIVSGAVLLAGLILSHNLTAFMSIIFIGLLVILQYLQCVKNGISIRSLLIAHCSLLILALGASAFFWLPAIAETDKTQVSQMVFEQFDPPAKHLITFNQLWTSPWGYGGSSAGIDDGLSFQLGKIHLMGSLMAIIFFVIVLRSRISLRETRIFLVVKNNFLTLFSIISLLVSLFMLLPPSRFIWDSIHVLSYIQFPWRFLTFASLFSSILVAWLIEVLIDFLSLNIKFIKFMLVIILYPLSLIFYSNFFQPQFKFPASAEELTAREKIIWEVSRRSDEYLPKGFILPTSLESALRVDNRQNQLLIDNFKKTTPIKQTANIASALFLAFLSLFILLSYVLNSPRPRGEKMKFCSFLAAAAGEKEQESKRVKTN